MEQKSWIRYIKNRINKNKNFLAICSGPTGSGKTYSMLSIAEQLDPEFNADRVVFKGKDLLALINSGNLKPGSVMLFDESQIDLNSRNWQSIMNKLLNYLLTTFRHRNFILLFTSPYVDFLDSSTLKLFHAEFQTKGINKVTNCVHLKPLTLQYNSSEKKWYRKFLITKKNGINGVKIQDWAVEKPSDKLIKEYELKKKDFTNNLNKLIEDKLAKLDDDGKPTKALTENQLKVLRCWEEGITKQVLIAKKIGMTPQQVSLIAISLRKKGHLKEKFLRESIENNAKQPNAQVNSGHVENFEELEEKDGEIE